MELWIRSQDRETLVNVKDVKLIYDWLCSDEVQLFHIDTNRGRVGSYGTKERALEVLDEIQKILEPQKTIETIDNTVKIENAIHIVNPTYETITQFDTYVYEMPKE